MTKRIDLSKPKKTASQRFRDFLSTAAAALLFIGLLALVLGVIFWAAIRVWFSVMGLI